MAKKANPNIKDFHAQTKRRFKKDGEEYIHENCKVCFDDGEAWKFSVDGGETWHTGKYPSGLNVIKINMKEPQKQKG